MYLDPQLSLFPLHNHLVELITTTMADAKIPIGSGAIINFSDPEYSAETGGFHPVEIHVGSDRRIQYITDFAYYGRPPQAELAKELDFDFRLSLFQHFGQDYPIEEGREIFKIWQNNFLTYHRMGVYRVKVEKAA